MGVIIFPNIDEEPYWLLHTVEGVSAQNRRYLNAYGGLKFLNLNDLVAVLIQDFIEQQNPVKTLTHTPVLENGVNSS